MIARFAVVVLLLAGGAMGGGDAFAQDLPGPSAYAVVRYELANPDGSRFGVLRHDRNLTWLLEAEGGLPEGLPDDLPAAWQQIHIDDEMVLLQALDWPGGGPTPLMFANARALSVEIEMVTPHGQPPPRRGRPRRLCVRGGGDGVTERPYCPAGGPTVRGR